MNEAYFYNPRTHRLHIRGYCKESKLLPYGVLFFKSEDEALAYDGRAVGLCKNCQRTRDRKGIVPFTNHQQDKEKRE